MRVGSSPGNRPPARTDHTPRLIPSGGVQKLSPNADLVQQRRCRGSGARHLSVRACVAPNQRCGAAFAWWPGGAPCPHSAAAAGRQFFRSPGVSPGKTTVIHGITTVNPGKTGINPRKTKDGAQRAAAAAELPPAQSVARRSQSIKGDTEQRRSAALDPLPAPSLKAREGGAGGKKSADSTMLLRAVSDVYTLYIDILIAVGKSCTK